jgi:WD40 repeat protein
MNSNTINLDIDPIDSDMNIYNADTDLVILETDISKINLNPTKAETFNEYISDDYPETIISDIVDVDTYLPFNERENEYIPNDFSDIVDVDTYLPFNERKNEYIPDDFSDIVKADTYIPVNESEDEYISNDSTKTIIFDIVTILDTYAAEFDTNQINLFCDTKYIPEIEKLQQSYSDYIIDIPDDFKNVPRQGLSPAPVAQLELILPIIQLKISDISKKINVINTHINLILGIISTLDECIHNFDKKENISDSMEIELLFQKCDSLPDEYKNISYIQQKILVIEKKINTFALENNSSRIYKNLHGDSYLEKDIDKNKYETNSISFQNIYKNTHISKINTHIPKINTHIPKIDTHIPKIDTHATVIDLSEINENLRDDINFNDETYHENNGSKKKLIASGGQDGSIIIWDGETYTPIHILKGHTEYIASIKFSPDGVILASGSGDCMIRLWYVESGTPLRTINAHIGVVRCLDFSTNGKKIISVGYDNIIKIWNTKTGSILSKISGLAEYGYPNRHTDKILAVKYFTNSNCFASCSMDRTIKIWNDKTCEIKCTLDTSGVSIFDISTDNKNIVSASDYLYAKHIESFHFLDQASFRESHIMEAHEKGINSIKISPDNSKIVSGSDDGTIKIWDTETNELLNTLVGHHQQVTCINFLDRGKKIVSASYDNTIKIWDTETGELLRTLDKHTSIVYSVACLN